MPLKARLNLCLLLTVPPFLLLAGRLSWLQVLQGDRLESLASRETARELTVPQPRGRILDRQGQVLAESIPSWSCYADRALLGDPGRAAEALAAPLGMPAPAVRRRLRVRARHVRLKKGLDLEQARAVARLGLPGVGLRQEERRAYPNGDLTISVLGALGAEGRGLSGLEHQFDAELRPGSARQEVLRDGKGRLIFQAGSTAPIPPKRLVLTIDRNFQYFAETALAQAVARSGARTGIVLAQDPATGEILVMANAPPDPLRNPAVQDVFEPGSTVKAFTAVAALAAGLVGLDETFDCEHGSWAMAPKVVIHDHEPQGPLTLSQILERSSNIGIAKVAERLGPERFYRSARAFGFGSRTGLGYPGEPAGILKGPRALDRVHLAQVAFGQGLGASALQLVAAFSALANGGALMEPLLVRGLQDEAGNWIRRAEPAVVRRAADPDAVRAVGRMLTATVDRGTGKAAAVPGYAVAGKTGTAQKIDPATGKYSRSLYTSSFIGYFPAENPRITLLVILDEPRRGYYGSDVAAPVFGRLAQDLLARLGLPPDRPVVAVSERPAGR